MDILKILLLLFTYVELRRCEDGYTRSLSRAPNRNRASVLNKAFDKFSKLIEEGERSVEFADGEIILVLGNIYSGKTTLTKYLTEENSKLTSVRNRVGSFVIEDTDGKINDSPKTIKTIFPELYYDINTNDAYYDCPGFHPDEVATEISEAYFMQQVIDNASKYKIILTVDYADVADNLDTTNVVSLLESVSDFVQNIQLYNNSMAMIVTKVESIDDDKSTIRSIAGFLENLRNEAQAAYNLDITNGEYKVTKILNILLHQNSTNTDVYDKIALFRRPDKIGTLDTIDSLQNTKNQIYSLIDSLEYANSAEGNILTPKLTDGAYDTMENLVTKARQRVKGNMERMLDEINTYNDLLLENTDDIFHTLNKVILPNLNHLETCIDFETFSFLNILNCVSRYQTGIYDMSNYFLDTAINLKHVEILQAIYGETIEDESNIVDYFLTGMHFSITNNLINYLSWAQIYESILHFFDTYENQINRQNLTDNVVFTTNDTDELIARLTDKYNISNTLSVRPRAEKIKQKVLHRIFQSATEYEVSYTCLPEGKLMISGSYIITSELDINHKCPGENITHVSILGLYKVYLDVLPEALQTKDLGIVTPRLVQIYFNIMTYGPTHRSRKFWALSHLNLFGKVHDYLYAKPCPEGGAQCYSREWAPVINHFKIYSILNGTIKKEEHLEYFKVLNKPSWGFVNVYDTIGFVDELTQLETSIHKSKNKIDFLPVYSDLLKRVEDYAISPYSNENGSDCKQALKYVYTATLTRICNIKNNMDNDLIIDIRQYLKLAIDDMKEYKEKSRIEAIHNLITRYKNNYNEEIDIKINEATRLVENYLSNVIEDLLKETESHLNNLLKEIAELKTNVEADIKYTEEKKAELEDIMKRKKILGIVSGIGKFFSLFGFWGALFSLALDAGIATANEFLPQDINFNRNITKLPAGVQELIGKTSLALEKVEDDRIKFLEDKLYVTLHYLSTSQNTFPISLAKFREIQIEVRSIKYKKSSLERIDVLNREFDNELATMRHDALRYKRLIGGSGLIDKIDKGKEIITYSKDLFKECKDDDEKLHKLSEIIKESKQKLKSLDQYEDKLNALIRPTVANMKSYIHDLERDVSYQSQVGIIVTKWDMQSTLKDLKFELQKITSGFKVEDDLARTIEELYDVLTTMMTIYERIQQYGDNRNMANLVTDIALAYNHGSQTEDDSEIQQSINHLDNVIQKNVILNQYERITNAFNQYVFPFADFFMEELRLPPSLADNTTQDVIDALDVLEKLERKLAVSFATIDHRIDTYLHDTTFHSNTISSKPFYVWNDSTYKALISRLLSGEEVVLKADIMRNVHEKNAIKFNSIGLHLRAIKRSAQEELDELLKNFGVEMTHMGTSYFRCDEKFYSILSQSQKIFYSFETGSQGRPLESNEVYKKIEKGDIMLSPYTFWKVKLTQQNEETFDILQKFENRIHLELVGHGYFVDMNSDVCKMNLENYYNVANPIYDMVNIISNL